MAWFNIHLDISPLLKIEAEFEDAAREALARATSRLAAQSHAHLLELVKQQLHSSRKIYEDALSQPQEVEPGVWLIELDKKAYWIEEGLDEHEMIDDLLKSKKAKTAKDGSKYLAVPFQHNKNPTDQSAGATDLTDRIKAQLKKDKAPWAKLEMDASGNPKMGLVRSFSIMDKPTKTHEGPGQGKGPIGAVRQGPTGIPFLQNVQIYQKEIETKGGDKKVQKFVMTFRTVSSKMKGSGRWVHPGYEGQHFINKTHDWAQETLERDIIPAVVREINERFK